MILWIFLALVFVAAVYSFYAITVFSNMMERQIEDLYMEDVKRISNRTYSKETSRLFSLNIKKSWQNFNRGWFRTLPKNFERFIVLD